MSKTFSNYAGMPGPFRLSGNKVKAVDHGKHYTLATIENGAFTDKAIEQHGKLFALSYDLVETLNQLVQDSECYCLNTDESMGRNPCPYCKAKGLLAELG